jgi:hypothetical protein
MGILEKNTVGWKSTSLFILPIFLSVVMAILTVATAGAANVVNDFEGLYNYVVNVNSGAVLNPMLIGESATIDFNSIWNFSKVIMVYNGIVLVGQEDTSKLDGGQQKSFFPV